MPSPDPVAPTAPPHQRRSVGQVLLQIPGDYLFERSRIPAEVIGLSVVIASALGGISAGTVFAINWATGKIPFTANVIRALYYWLVKRQPFSEAITYWSRPQAHQRSDVAPAPEQPMETSPDAKGVPRIVRWLTKTAERDDIPWIAKQTARFFDDWLAMRSRIPATVIEIALLSTSLFLTPLPWIVIFPVNLVVGGIPEALAFWLAVRNRDFRRWSRSGIFQRYHLRSNFRARALREAQAQLESPRTRRITTPGLSPAPHVAYRISPLLEKRLQAPRPHNAAPQRQVEL